MMLLALKFETNMNVLRRRRCMVETKGGGSASEPVVRGSDTMMFHRRDC